MQRIILSTLFLFVLSLLEVSCTKDLSADPDSIVVALATAPATLDPRFATDANGMRIAGLLFNSLVKIGPELDVVGDAAESWEYQDKVYKFRLRQGLKFSNGRPITPEDIQFTFSEYQSSISPFRTALTSVKSVDVSEDSRGLLVKITLNEFSAKFLASDLPAIKIIPKAEVLKHGSEFNQYLIGTGSFKFETQTANEIILSSRFDHTFAPPKIKRVVFKIIRDDFTRFQKTIKGSVDIAQAEIPLNKIKDFSDKPDEFQVFRYPGLSMSYILINFEDPILKEKSVRNALAQGINREEIIKYKLEGFARPATSILTPNNPYFDKSLTNSLFDVSKAKGFIEKLGLQGKELVLKTSNNQSAVDNGKIIANQLNLLGLKVKLESFEWGTFYEDVQKGKFQMATLRWIGALDPDIYRLAFHSSEKPPGRNRGRYVNPNLDRILEQGLKESNKTKRMEIYQKVQKIINDDLAIIPLWYDEQVAIVHRRVNNYQPHLGGDFSPLIQVSKK
jgi:peptide/nickel transport system substrate-binding protein